MKSKSSNIRILYADSENNADVLYLSGVFIPDPFLSIITEKHTYAVVNRLEYNRVLQTSKYDKVLLLEDICRKAAASLRLPLEQIGPGELMIYFGRYFQVNQIEVPSYFPAAHYKKLFEAGYRMKVFEGDFFPERAEKVQAEAQAIRRGNIAAAAGIRAAENVLRAGTIRGNRIIYEGKALTSDRLRTIVDQVCLTRGGISNHTIVAGGRQACDPHEAGRGFLKPNELIIIDVFPRIQQTGYHGDMTRTFLKGQASPAQRALVQAVRTAQMAAMEAVQAGVPTADVHEAACAVFRNQGFITERRKSGFVGFIHSTGHGLGLDIHEAPRLSKGTEKLQTGHVITIEPGLYYPEIGGCRIEDVVWVNDEGHEKLSRMHYRWEIE